MRLKLRVAAFALATAVVTVLTAGAALGAPPVGGGVGAEDATGDHPPTTSFVLKGRIGVTVAALPYHNGFAGVANPSGTFNVSGIPAGSTIVKALLYLTDWQTGTSASAIFAGAPVGPSSAITTDSAGGLTLGTYRFNVTARVTGNGSYAYTSSGITESYGSALVVVYKNGTLSKNRIWINDGSEIICCNTTSQTVFAGGSSRISQGRLLIFTEADDNIPPPPPPGDSGEVISFNGGAVGGPIDANLGPYASLFDIPVIGVGASNTASINTPNDFFGWHLAILSRKRQ